MMLATHDLVCARGGLPVLERVNLAVAAGGILLLRGPNGVGKTTLLRTLAGLQPPLAGRIAMEPDIAAYASHADGVKATLSVTENLTFWADVHGRALQDSVLARFDLSALRDRMAGTLSAGQKRRLGLARLAVTGRALLLLDEPTVSLDASSVGLFTRFLTAHLAGGGAAVIATHLDLDIAAQTLDLGPCRAAADAGGGSDEAFL